MMIYRTQIERLRARAAARGEDGFTLVELLITVEIIGILLLVAVPSYLDFRLRAADTTAKSNLRSAIESVELFAHDNVGAKGDADNKAGTSGYKGMTAGILRSTYDPGLSDTLKVVSGKTKVDRYCLTETQSGRTWSLLGPPGSPVDDAFRQNNKCK
jgi:type IV pilus assembly protein PilA